MTVRVHKRLGHYNLMRPSEQQWLLEISGLPEDAPARAVSAMFDEDEEPAEDEGSAPTEVAEEIYERNEWLWLSTSRDRDRQVIEWIRANSERVDADWAQGRLPMLQRRRESLDDEISRLEQMKGEGEPA